MLEKGIYNIKIVDKKCELIYDSYNKKTPTNIYGNVGDRVVRYWNKFVKSDNTVGVLLIGAEGSTGGAGAGKTLEADLLANMAISKGNMPVICLTGVRITSEIIKYIETLDNVVLYLDEFSKHFDFQAQQYFLPLLTNSNRKYLVIMTDNESTAVSQYIKSRPGRAWYRKTFDKLEKDILEDYLSRYNNIKDEFKKDLIEKYEMAYTFTFDHLKALVDEHLDYPDETLDEMLSILNVDLYNRDKILKVIKVVDSEDKDVPYTPTNFNINSFTNNARFFGAGCVVPLTPVDSPSIRLSLSKENVIYKDDALLILKTDGYTVTCQKE